RQGYLIKPDRTRALDSDFLNFLDGVRQQLGSDLLKHNDRADLLSGHRLNEAAQRIIDRLVFLRICEDRGIDTGTLLETLFTGWYRQQPESRQPKLRKVSHQTHLRFGSAAEEEPGNAYTPRQPAEGGLYRELTEHIRALDQRPPSYKPFFNGQLFKPHFSEDLVVGDEWLANFILDLTADDSGYNFADIKVEILGDAYERFLGHILVPKGRGTAIEEKPEVRKAGGVYYTPRYITDYIVEQTIGRLLDGKTPKEVEKLRFLDPACGSGSFLIRAYERVMEHYLRYFTANPDKRRKDDCFVDAAGNVRLTTALKRRILENNIYGVDIDAQAVEVTQLSLYLKMLEGENRDTLRQQTELFRGEPLLPPLDKNIKCFNSLIGSDFSLDPAELIRVNAGDWDVHFEPIMKAGGFDAVVGNPPYIQLSMEEFRDPLTNEYLKERFKMSGGRMNTFIFFLERAREITRHSGAFGYIVPNTILTQEYYADARMRTATLSSLEFIVQPKGQIFADAVVETVVIVARKASPTQRHLVTLGDLPETGLENAHRVAQSEFGRNYKWSFVVPADPALQALKDKLSALPVKFGDSLNINQAIALKHDRDACLTEKKLTARHHEILDGRHIGRYFTGSSPSFFKFDLEKIHSCKREDIFQLPEKIFFRRVGDSLIGSLDHKQKYALNTLVVISPTEATAFATKFVLGLFNSKLLNFYYTTFLKSSKKVFSEIQARQVAQLPMPNFDRKSADGQQHHDRLVALVDKMLTLTPALRAAKTDAEKATLQNALTKTDREIDQLVYQLYALTPEEIALVEGTAQSPA
ncbi:MAG: N-6 DNA methylase, partial [Opitutaceae bacterium]|nr:N-6 DNA methylase [Opitutaceae bacterium]